MGTDPLIFSAQIPQRPRASIGLSIDCAKMRHTMTLFPSPTRSSTRSRHALVLVELASESARRRSLSLNARGSSKGAGDASSTSESEIVSRSAWDTSPRSMDGSLSSCKILMISARGSCPRADRITPRRLDSAAEAGTPTMWSGFGSGTPSMRLLVLQKKGCMERLTASTTRWSGLLRTLFLNPKYQS